MKITKPSTFSMRDTVFSHGWYQLAPFGFEETEGVLDFAFESGGRARHFSVRETAASILIRVDSDEGIEGEQAGEVVRRILRLNEPFGELHKRVEGSKSFGWIKSRNKGPMLRSPTVFEDVVKTICTTNCSWGLTKSMVSNLVETLGRESATGKRAFPNAATIAAQDSGFFKNEIRAGYRGPYLLELAESVAIGKVDPESWLESELPTTELKKKIRQVKGVGDYAAEHVLKLLGRYDGLALDSFLRSSFYRHYNHGKPCTDKIIENKYDRFGDWRGLVIWFDMVEKESAEREV